MGRPWYRISNATGATAELLIYDDVGYGGVTASDFARELEQVSAGTINLHINSPGGEVFDGLAIFEALRTHPATVVTHIDALAASIASIIAMAGDRVLIAPAGTVMVHDAQGVTFGNEADHLEQAAVLARVSDTLAGVYAMHTGQASSYWRGLMRDETWFSADEAVAAGLADRVNETAGQRRRRTDPMESDPSEPMPMEPMEEPDAAELAGALAAAMDRVRDSRRLAAMWTSEHADTVAGAVATAAVDAYIAEGRR